MPSMDKIAWIAADWGTSRLRVWAMDENGTALAHRVSDKGMGALDPDAFEGALLEIVEDWLGDSGDLPIIACGMVGARQGWVEAAYAPCPGPPLAALGLTRAPAQDTRLDMRIVPGLAQPSPADVMRGEETQVAGLLAHEPDFAGILCLPGTHTKWVHIAQGRVERFTSCMTGEVFAVLSDHSILRHSVEGAEMDHAAFTAALDEQGPLLPRLFSLRAESLLHGMHPSRTRARLSALLIGAEVDAMMPVLGDLALLGDAGLSKLYAIALARQGIAARILDADAMTLAGLRAAYTMEKDPS